MLLVDDDQAKFGELDAFFQQGVGADDQVGVALRDVPADFALAILFERASEQDDAVSGAFQDAPRGEVMLLRENFGGRHERDLASVFNRDDCGFEGDNRFAGADIALKQTAHGIRLLHVGGDFFQYALLCRGRMKGQNLLDGVARPVVEPESDAGLRLHLTAAEFEAQFHEEQFLEDQPEMRGRARGLQIGEALSRLGPMHLPQGFDRRNEAHARTNGGRNWVGQSLRDVFERAANDAPEPACGQPALARGLVDGNDAADFQRGGLFLVDCVARSILGRLAQDFKLRLHDLQFAVAIGLDFPVERNHLARA